MQPKMKATRLYSCDVMRRKSECRIPGGWIIALLAGSTFGGLSFFMEQLASSGVIYFLLPGAIVGILFSGNVHSFEAWAVAVGNFVFYFGLTYSLLALADKYGVWEKYSNPPK